MPYDVTFTQETLCKGAMRAVDEVLNVDDETARMLVDLGVATASGLSPQTGSSAALFADTFLAKTNNLSEVTSPSVARSNIDATSPADIVTAVAGFPSKAEEWDDTREYKKGDFVLFNNGVFVALKDGVNKMPVFEVPYWTDVGLGSNWLDNPWKGLTFSNSKSLGTGTATNGSSTPAYARLGLASTTTSGNAIRIARVLSVGVPTYWHTLLDRDMPSQGSNRINFAKAGRLRFNVCTSNRTNPEIAGVKWYFDFGRTYSEASGSGTETPLNSELPRRGFGWQMEMSGDSNVFSSFEAVYHDGTTLFKQPLDFASFWASGAMQRYEITWNGLGSYAYFVNGKEVARFNGKNNDLFGIPTWGCLAAGGYNGPNYTGVPIDHFIWVNNEDTGFLTYGTIDT